MDYKELFSHFPKSDVQLAKAIGISAKTLKRLKTGTYKPNTFRTHNLIIAYLKKIHIIIWTFIN